MNDLFDLTAGDLGSAPARPEDISAAMAEYGVSPEQLAVALQVTYTTVTRWRSGAYSKPGWIVWAIKAVGSGRVPAPSDYTLKHAAKRLGVSHQSVRHWRLAGEPPIEARYAMAWSLLHDGGKK